MEKYNGKRRTSRGRSVIRNEPKRLVSSQVIAPSQSFSLEKLIRMSEEKPDEIIQYVMKERNSLISMIEDEALTDRKIMTYVLIVLGKAAASGLQNKVNSVISSLSNCKTFYSVHVPQYLASFHQSGWKDGNDSEALKMLTQLLTKFHHCMPCTAMETTAVLFPLLENTVEALLTHDEEALSLLLEKIVETNLKNREFQQSIKPREVRHKTAKERMQLRKPPENYRTLPILPTPRDIHRSSSFLRPNLSRGEYEDAEHYLDVQFRLLREDYIRPLREGISDYLRLKEKNVPVASVQDATIHGDVRVERIDFNEKNIVHWAVFHKDSFAEVNWEHSKRFINGSLLCFSDDDFRTFYLATVVQRNPKELSEGKLGLEFQNPTNEVLNFSPKRKFVVIETNAYFEAYKHNLTVLSLLDEEKLPMKPYILKVQKTVDVPAYLKEDDCFDIRGLFHESEENAEVLSRYENFHVLDEDSWPKHSDLNLDFFQLAAIKAALTKEFCIIQGPPGTGKSFVGLKIVEILLANKHKWQLEGTFCPILVVCYTNHALDQFLEDLLSFTKSIVRIGGSSSNDKMKDFNLKSLGRNCGTLDEIYERIQRIKREIELSEKSLTETNYGILDECCLRYQMDFRHYNSFVSMRQFVNEKSNIMSEWLGHEKEKNGKINSVRVILNSINALSENEAKNVSIKYMPMKLRWRLYKMWLNKYLEEKRTKLFRSKALLKKQQEECWKIKRENDVLLCREANVIGMTTTGAAKHRNLLQQVSPKIVVVEEAAEILESHIVTSLSPGTEHVILIGDHQQLRPNPTAHALALHYDLDVSLFERMVRNGMPFNRLNMQHRMRPEMASLLVPHFYEDLRNHESVEHFENVKGVDKNVFYLSHSHQEASDDSKSKMNLFEAKFIVALYRYLLLQGYESSQITILTTYSGQKFTIRKELERRQLIQEGDVVRVEVVDNYQGEENEIILISFVRSNSEKSIGFLKTSNRVCVALSRAKKGFFGIGNFELLADESNLWKEITDKLKERAAIGLSLKLKCQNHPDTFKTVADEKDFDSVPEGGCSRDCDFRLECGHQCPLKCHPYDREHADVTCHKPCNRRCIRGHSCSRKCYEDCGDCIFMVDKVVDSCGHETEVFCHRKEEEAVCPELCPNFFTCFRNGSKVKGVFDNVCFVSYSSKNGSELNFMKSFQAYLFLQGYERSDVVIMSNQDKTEAANKDLILAVFYDLLNEEDFLIKSTQMLVTLSRANKGAFAVGDFLSFAEKSDFWKSITSALMGKCKMGSTLRLQCQNHPDMCETISPAKDFLFVSSGGCTKQCESQLSCGHTCPLQCHMYDKEHDRVKCLEPCERKCDLGHLCTKICHEVCECSKMVDQKVESCGHVVKVECHLRDEPVECKKTIPVKLLECNHPYNVVCCMRKSALTYFFPSCEVPCKTALPCGHACEGTCGSCSQGRLHISCKKRCRSALMCGHKCPAPCFETCPPCELPCRKRCKHRVCRKTCGEPCDPCTRPCGWKCPHERCNEECGQKCDRKPCDQPCDAALKCGHKCIGLCGEPCPRQCRTCHEGFVKKACRGKDIANARFVRLEDCGHVFEVSELAERMIQGSGDNVIQGKKKCPLCKRDILNNLRFGNVIKTRLEGIELVKINSVKEKYKLNLNLLKAAKQIRMPELRIALVKCLNTMDRNIRELNVLENFVSILLNFDSVFSEDTKVYNFKSKQESKLFDLTLNLDLCDKLQAYITEARKWMTTFILKNSTQASLGQLRELGWEAYRVALADKLIKTLESVPELNLDASQQLNDLMNSLLTIVPFHVEDAETFHSSFQNFIFSIAPESGKVKIPALKSVSFSEGNWFICPKGHAFCSITCLMTSEVKTCYECDPSIAFTPTGYEEPHVFKERYIQPDSSNSSPIRYSEQASNKAQPITVNRVHRRRLGRRKYFFN